MSGKPGELYLDNAAEFKSEALRRGCQQHGIVLRYRPAGRPHYGGIVERVIGTLMQLVHELPGTTFSNPAQRGDYDADAKATLTLGELQRWLAVAVAGYHGQVHGTTRQTPASRWSASLTPASAPGGAPSGVAVEASTDVPAGASSSTAVEPVVVTNEAAFLVDFLPVLRRTLTRTGFVIDHVHYFCDGLKPWIARRDRLDRFVIRRDPRDISRVWVLEPEGQSYLEVPYRSLTHPPVSLWEHQAALQRLHTLGRDRVDEDALFQMVEQMRAITDAAAASTRRARRDATRRAAVPARPLAGLPEPPADACPGASSGAPAGDLLGDHPGTRDVAGEQDAIPFEVIEQW